MNWNRPLGMAAFLALCASPAYGQLRICNYNILASSGTINTGMSTVLTALGQDNTIGFSKPIDILLVQETKSQETTTQQVVNVLNSIYGAGAYARGSVNPASSGGGMTGFVYRVSTVSLVNEIEVGTVDSSAGAARAQVRAQFRPVGYDSSADFYIYNGHYKASSGSSNETRRLGEADVIRRNADALGQGARIIFGGDFNTYSSTEKMLTGSGSLLGLTSAGNAQAHDPLNRPGSWNNNAAFVDIASQAPDTNPPAGFVAGGLNSRFDMQYPTDEMLSGEGVSYIAGSYHTFMNNGSVPMNSAIDVAANTALPSLPNRASVLTALTTASDHLPLVVDYQVPAKMNVSVASLPTAVITGAAVNLNVSVSNSASALTIAGADELDYTGTASGKLAGSISGTDNALGGSNAHSLTLNTTTPGLATGTISVNATSPGAASASFSQVVSSTVLAHANPTLSSTADVDAATIDFGIRAGGAGTATTSFALQNRADASGFTAGLKLVSISGTGATTQLTTNAATFSSLAAGASNMHSAMMALGNYGTFSATYTFATADEDLPGATARENLVLSLRGVVALGGDTNLDGFVETSDFNTVAGNFSSSGMTWADGDFNADGIVDSTDFATLAGSYGQHVTMASPALGTVVPEPAGLLIPLVTLFAQSRRRRH